MIFVSVRMPFCLRYAARVHPSPRPNPCTESAAPKYPSISAQESRTVVFLPSRLRSRSQRRRAAQFLEQVRNVPEGLMRREVCLQTGTRAYPRFPKSRGRKYFASTDFASARNSQGPPPCTAFPYRGKRARTEAPGHSRSPAFRSMSESCTEIRGLPAKAGFLVMQPELLENLRKRAGSVRPCEIVKSVRPSRSASTNACSVISRSGFITNSFIGVPSLRNRGSRAFLRRVQRPPRLKGEEKRPGDVLADFHQFYSADVDVFFGEGLHHAEDRAGLSF